MSTTPSAGLDPVPADTTPILPTQQRGCDCVETGETCVAGEAASEVTQVFLDLSGTKRRRLSVASYALTGALVLLVGVLGMSVSAATPNPHAALPGSTGGAGDAPARVSIHPGSRTPGSPNPGAPDPNVVQIETAPEDLSTR